jgi:hypothetical protein
MFLNNIQEMCRIQVGGMKVDKQWSKQVRRMVYAGNTLALNKEGYWMMHRCKEDGVVEALSGLVFFSVSFGFETDGDLNGILHRPRQGPGYTAPLMI